MLRHIQMRNKNEFLLHVSHHIELVCLKYGLSRFHRLDWISLAQIVQKNLCTLAKVLFLVVFQIKQKFSFIDCFGLLFWRLLTQFSLTIKDCNSFKKAWLNPAQFLIVMLTVDIATSCNYFMANLEWYISWACVYSRLKTIFSVLF